MRAFVFPGQGAQVIGMGRELAEAYPAARAVFDEVDETLGENLSGLIWDGDIETLTLTPLDRRLIAPGLLSADEIAWLDGYHARVRDEISPLVGAEVRDWLHLATRPLGASA